MVTYDIRHASLDDFLLFLFDHEAPAERPTIDEAINAALQEAARSGKPPEIRVEFSVTSFMVGDEPSEPEPWWYNAEVRFDSGRLVRLYQEFFRRPEIALNRFSPEQLDHGFAAAHSVAGNEWSVADLIWNDNVAFNDRAELIRSIADLFRGAASFDAVGGSEAKWWSSLHMWWDSIAYDWHCGNRSRDNGGEDEFMQDVIFETLSGILSIEHPAARGSALHGLGHLRHPDTRSLIEGWIESHRDEIDDETRAYASAASRFDVL